MTVEVQHRDITITFEEGAKSVPYGTLLANLAKSFQPEAPAPIVLAEVDGKLTELTNKLSSDCKLRWFTMADEIGYAVYCRSLHLLFLKAVHDILGRTKVVVHFTVSNGYYYTLDPSIPIENSLLERISMRMRTLCKEAHPIRKRSVPTDDARKLFRFYGMPDKDLLFRFRRASFVNIYELAGFEDYFYGYMVPNTEILGNFGLLSYEDGIVLQMPSKANPDRIEPFSPSGKVFETQWQSERWGEQLQVDTIGRLNLAISEGGMERIMLVQEALQEGRIVEIAKRIKEHPEIKFVLIAGPSSSGKTTFSRRLSIQLSALGMSPHPISLDNYYKERHEIPKDETGAYDFESIDALDLELFRTDMQNLLSGKEVSLPRYNFTNGKKEYKGNRLKLGDQDILVLEGIHGLNDRMTEGLPDEYKFRIYISALTQLNIDEHNRVPTTDGRLIRRIVRDYRTRATSAQETIAMWNSVRNGEEKYIFPNQDRADEVVNSALIYEMSILKIYAEPLLFQIPETAPEYPEAKRLLKFFDYFVGLPSEAVPNNSILREFIGGSCFDV